MSTVSQTIVDPSRDFEMLDKETRSSRLATTTGEPAGTAPDTIVERKPHPARIPFWRRFPATARATGINPWLRLVVACVLAALTASLLAPSANAASSSVGDFSSLLSPNVRTFYVDDCTAEVGVVVDSVRYPYYRHVGGVRVNCRTVHSVIDATVALYYYNGSRWVQYGNGAYGVRYYQSGSGYGLGGILSTPAYCVGSYRAYYWMVGATVRTERAGLTNYSFPAADPRGGC